VNETKQKTCGKDHTYNGWTNYETWLVALWIDNDQGTHEEARAMALRAARDPEPESMIPGHSMRAYYFGVQIKEWVEETMIGDHGATLVADLLNGALSEVDWRSIAEHFLDDVPADEEVES